MGWKEGERRGCSTQKVAALVKAGDAVAWSTFVNWTDYNNNSGTGVVTVIFVYRFEAGDIEMRRSWCWVGNAND